MKKFAALALALTLAVPAGAFAQTTAATPATPATPAKPALTAQAPAKPAAGKVDEKAHKTDVKKAGETKAEPKKN